MLEGSGSGGSSGPRFVSLTRSVPAKIDQLFFSLKKFGDATTVTQNERHTDAIFSYWASWYNMEDWWILFRWPCQAKGEKSNLGKETSWSSYCQLKEVFDLRFDGGLVVVQLMYDRKGPGLIPATSKRFCLPKLLVVSALGSNRQ